MATKHFVTDAEETVRDALEVLAWADPSLGYDRKNKSLINTTHNPSTHVSLFSGGGAGHEPAHAQYVGHAMLAGAISGSIFASPSVAQIVSAVTLLHKESGASDGKGVLLVVKNYTGDVLHFNLAASKLRTAGIKVSVVVVGDDVSVGRAKSGRVGRRGLAGTVFVHKIAGALAAESGSLEDVTKIAEEVAGNLVTVAASLDHVHVPGRAKDEESFLGEQEMELGMGIHNEPGSEKIKVPELKVLIGRMLDQLLDPNDKDRAYLSGVEGGEFALMVNNLGGLSVLELGAIAKVIVEELTGTRKITISRFYTGTFMTSLNGPGFSITLLRTTSHMLTLLDAPTSAPGWTPKALKDPTTIKSPNILTASEHDIEPTIQGGYKLPTQAFTALVTAGCKSLIAAEPQITKFDTIAGDGDCGETLKAGAQAVTAFLDSKDFTSDAVGAFAKLADLAEESMGGTSGALYSIFLHGATSWFREQGDVQGKEAGKEQFVQALKAALRALEKATPARVGDRTMMDALSPFVEALVSSGGDVGEAVKKAQEGCQKTESMEASLGRAVYVGGTGYQGVPDPGAAGVVAFVEGVAGARSK